MIDKRTDSLHTVVHYPRHLTSAAEQTRAITKSALFLLAKSVRAKQATMINPLQCDREHFAAAAAAGQQRASSSQGAAADTLGLSFLFSPLLATAASKSSLD